MTDFAASAEPVSSIAAKLTVPAGVSLSTIAGYQVSELVLWLTLVYTILLLAQKLVQICRDIWGKK